MLAATFSGLSPALVGQGFIVVDLLFPTDEQTAKTVYPLAGCSWVPLCMKQPLKNKPGKQGRNRLKGRAAACTGRTAARQSGGVANGEDKAVWYNEKDKEAAAGGA